MLSEQDKVDKAVELVKKYVPNLKVTFKSQSRLHRAINKVLTALGNPRYLSGNWTTIHTWLARPTMVEDSPHPREWEVILHEGQHAIDSSRLGALPFAFLYLFPQLLGALCVLAALVLVPFILTGLSPWFLLVFLGGFLLLPLPAIGRTYYEFRSFSVSLGVAYWAKNIDDEEFWIDSVTEIFAGKIYYKMWPFKKLTKKWLQDKLEEYKRGTQLSPYLADCKKLALEFREWH